MIKKLIALCGLFCLGFLIKVNAAPNSSQIALLLPLNGTYAKAGINIRDGFLHAFDEGQKQGAQLSVRVYDTSKGNSAQLYQEAVQNGANLIIGPLTKEDVSYLESKAEIKVPTIALNYTANNMIYPSLYQFGLSPQNEAAQVAAKAFDDGKRHSLIIAPNSQWGESVANSFLARFQELGGSNADIILYKPGQDFDSIVRNFLQIETSQGRANNLQAALREKFQFIPTRRQDIDMIFMIATPTYARQIVPLLRYYYADNLNIYSTSAIYSGMAASSYNRDVNHVIFCDTPWTLSHQTTEQKPEAENNDLSQSNSRFYALGMDVYTLANNLDQLAKGSQDNLLPGATGAITLNPSHKIYQIFEWAQFNDGQVNVLS
jgi:outer membrane PBP1 activator LpoA protein